MLPYHNKYLILISSTLDATGNRFVPYFLQCKNSCRSCWLFWCQPLHHHCHPHQTATGQRECTVMDSLGCEQNLSGIRTSIQLFQYSSQCNIIQDSSHYSSCQEPVFSIPCCNTAIVLLGTRSSILEKSALNIQCLTHCNIPNK